MKKFKGTPGTWHYDDELGGVYSKSCLFVCDITDKDNASLIAAAPELLEALQFIINDCSRMIPKCAEDKAIAAIKKALGEKQ